MANVTREKRENTFFKLVEYHGALFYKLQTSSEFFFSFFFFGRRILFKMSKPPHTIYKFKIWLSHAISSHYESRKIKRI